MTVKQIQLLLDYLAIEWNRPELSPGAIDGLQGSVTMAAVRTFQSLWGLEADGVPGNRTQQALREAVAGNKVPEQNEAGGGETAGWHSRYFRREEFRCPCGRWCNGFPVEPSPALVALSDDVREALGVTMVIVPLPPADPHAGGTGVRCVQYNATLPGSVSDSYHLRGKAADFSAPGASNTKIKQVLARFKAEGRIHYWYHIGGGSFHMDVY